MTQYITTMAAVVAILREAASLASGTRFVCSFILAAERAASNRHPWISCFCPSQFAALAHQVGFSQVRHVSADELRRLYFADRSDGFRPISAEHLQVATV